MPSIHPSLIKPVRLSSEIAKSSDEQMKPISYDILKFIMDDIEPKNNSSRSLILLGMATTAGSDGDYDRAIALVREALSVTCDYDIHVMLYECLIIIYHKQKNWPAVIESCQCIIDMPEIPPSSSAIVEAHIRRGDACIELDDLSEAFLSYTKALELQSQHHVPNHPLTSEIHHKIGNVFEKTGDVPAALESYNKAITLGSPDTSSTLYEKIGSMYMRLDNYDVARSNFIKCLEIQEGSIPHKTFRLACTHIRLALVEHKTEHYQQRDFHIQQARKITDHDEEERDLITEQISQILGEVTPTTS
jgi:tetratricopeptide (TPR) repeat protein